MPEAAVCFCSDYERGTIGEGRGECLNQEGYGEERVRELVDLSFEGEGVHGGDGLDTVELFLSHLNIIIFAAFFSLTNSTVRNNNTSDSKVKGMPSKETTSTMLETLSTTINSIPNSFAVLYQFFGSQKNHVSPFIEVDDVLRAL